jgi:parallel beta-helix repeat protein
MMAGVQKRKIQWAKTDQKKGEQKMKSMTNKNLYKSLPVIFAGAILMLVAQGVLAGQTFTVTNTNDSGPGSLRQAIESSNYDAGVDVIAFNIPAWGRQPGPGPHTIQPLTPLPHITDTVIIDGYTQPGAAPATDDTPATLLIELDGINVIGLHWDSGLNIDHAGNSTVRGLVINRFGDVGIHIQDQGGNIIEGNYIGTDVTGTMNRGNFQGGVRIWDAPNNMIGGTTPEARNVISGNNGYAVGILLPGATANKVQGNFIGTDVTGTADLGNSNHGVFIYEAASSNTIGPGNVIVGNGGAGIGIHGIGATENRILGNNIGTDVTGTISLGNFDHGVRIWDAPNNTIGGTTPEARNVISGNNHMGVQILLAGAKGNKVQGNYIGIAVNGTTPLGNGDHGVEIREGASDNTIGPGNVISGNGGTGIEINGAGVTGNQILGNFIGTDASRRESLGNTYAGVRIISCTDNTLTDNTVSNNGYGIQLQSSSDNQIYNNNFIDNTIQAYATTGRRGNIFNLDKPIGGNYWSDWTNPDADGDGFVDYPYVFTGGVDYLPWARQAGMAPILNVYHVDAVYGDDDNGGLAPEAAFATIQKGIDMAGDGDVVLVYSGLYQEEINFLGKALTVQGVAAGPAGVPVLQNPGGFAVSFYYGEGPDSILKNFIIRDSFMAVFIAGSAPTISNLTVVDNKYGIEAYAGSEPDISNTIFWNNTDGDLFGCRASYSCMERGGEGNINADPLFVDPDSGDYHLRSERGRYWPEHDVWVLDEITSPCVDGGDPTADYSGEPMPNGGRINMGAYGGTPEASLSPAPPPPPPKGRGCFLADTLVCVNGALVQISNVVSGQMVGELHCGLATDCLEQIETVEEHEGTFECRDIVLESGNRISVVDAHCFMLDSGQWIAAQDLRSGLRLKTLSGTVGIKSVATRAAPFVGKVYNLKVTGVDRYLVSEDGVIVRDY